MFLAKIRAKRLEDELSNQKFLLRGAAFIGDGKVAFVSKKEAKKFLVNFLLVEAVAGTNPTSKKLLKTRRKIKQLIRKNESLFSEDLPIIPPKQQADKELQGVYYSLEGTVCQYKRDCK